MVFWRIIGVCSIFVALTACAGQEAVPQIPPGAATNINAVDAAQSQAFVVPTPVSATAGTVSGQLLKLEDNSATRPFSGMPLFLGKIITSDQGVDGLVELRKNIAPKTVTDAQGNFAFTDVEPGKYGLMMDTPQGAILLNKPSVGTNFIIEVKGGEINNVGELPYDIGLEPQ